MIDCKRYIEDVESSKDRIAHALAIAFAGGDSKRAKLYFEDFYNVLIKDNKTFFLSYDNGYSSEYDKRTDSLLIELYELVGYEITPYVDRPLSREEIYSAFSKESYKGISDEIIEKAKKRFENNYENYTKKGIDFNNFFKIYIDGKANRLDELLVSIEKEMRMYNLKRELSIHKDMLL